MIYAFIKKGSFQDSVSLMIISRKLSEHPEVDQVSVMMGTPANKAMLDSTGFWHDDFADATPNDICVAARTHEEQPEILGLIREQLEKELSAIATSSGSSQQLLKARRWESACQKLPQANLLLVSVAGEYAASVARDGLLAGMNVMMFSDNVPLEQEVELKILARERGLILMTDPDGAGFVIRNYLKGSIPPEQIKQAYVPEAHWLLPTFCQRGELGSLAHQVPVFRKSRRR